MSTDIERYTDSGLITLQQKLDFQISDGSKKMPVFINDDNQRAVNCIMLFEQEDSILYNLGRKTQAGYYGLYTQIACRHKENQRARKIARAAQRFLSVNSDDVSWHLRMQMTPPEYAGIDDNGYVWIFYVTIKGGES